MFHDLFTFHDSFEQFSDFNGVFRGFLSKKMFLCTRETLCEPKAKDACIILLRRSQGNSNIVRAESNRCLHRFAEANPRLYKHFEAITIIWER